MRDGRRRTTCGTIASGGGWRSSFRTLLRASKRIQNETIKKKVARNLKLAFHLLPAEEGAGQQQQQQRFTGSGRSYNAEERHEAALRLITALSGISQHEFVNTFHVIHAKDESSSSSSSADRRDAGERRGEQSSLPSE